MNCEQTLTAGPLPLEHSSSLQILCNDDWDERHTTQAVEGK